jgi:imidazolonepropionase-like amidohydrolase
VNAVRLRTLASVATCTVLAAPAAAQSPATIAIQNARIVPVSGPAIDTGTIVIGGGLIRAVGARVEVPSEAVVIDGTGLTIYPGLIDAMSDFGLTSGGASSGAQSGGSGQAGPPRAATPARPARGPQDRPGSTPWLQAADEFRPDARRLETWRHGGFTAIVATPSTGILPGQSAVINLSGAERTEAVVRSRVALPVSMRPSGGFASFPGSLMGVMAYVRQVFSDTRHYGALSRQYESNPRGRTRPEYDRTVLALHEALTAKTPVLLPAVTVPEIDRMLRFAQELEVPAVLYGGHEAAGAAPRLAQARVPVLVSAKWPEKSRDADPDAVESLRVLELREQAPAAPAALAAQKVTFAFYSDGLPGPKEMMANVRKAIAAGLTADAALRALTLDAAQIYGVADRLGSLEAGKIANLVVTSGPLFDEKTTITHVFVDGTRFDVPEAPSPARSGPPTSSAPRLEGVR